jgi:hypothetical protein
MAEFSGTVKLTGVITPPDDTDTFAVFEDTYGRGGYRAVADNTERDAITSDRRKIGMMVHVSGTNVTYILTGATNSDWEILSSGGGGATSHGALTDLLVDDHPQYALTGQNVTFSDMTATGTVRSDIGVLRLHEVGVSSPQDDTTGIWFTDNNTGASITLGGGGSVNVTMPAGNSVFHVRTGQTLLDQDLTVGNLMFVNSNNYTSVSGGGKVYFHDGVTNAFAESFGFITANTQFEISNDTRVFGDLSATSVSTETANISSKIIMDLESTIEFEDNGGSQTNPTLSYSSGSQRFEFSNNGADDTLIDVWIKSGLTVSNDVIAEGEVFASSDVSYYIDGTPTTGSAIQDGLGWSFIPSGFTEWTFTWIDSQEYRSGVKDFTLFWDDDQNEYHIIGINTVASGYNHSGLAYKNTIDFLWVKSPDLSGNSFTIGGDDGLISSICTKEVDGKQIDMVWAPHLLKNDNAYYMFYTGIDWNGDLGLNGPNSKQQIFVAKTYDLNDWSSPELKFCFDGDVPWTTYSAVAAYSYHCRDPHVEWDEDFNRWLMTVSIEVDSAFSDSGFDEMAVGLASATTLMGSWTLYDWIRETENDAVESSTTFKGPDDLWYLHYSADDDGGSFADKFKFASATTLSDVSGYTNIPALDLTAPNGHQAAEILQSPYNSDIFLMPWIDPYPSGWSEIRFDYGLTFSGGFLEYTTSHSAVTIPHTATTWSRSSLNVLDQIIGHMGEHNVHYDIAELDDRFTNISESISAHTHIASEIGGEDQAERTFSGGTSSHFYFPAKLLVKGNELYIDSDANSSTSTIDFRSGVSWIQYNNVSGQFRMGPDTKDTIVFGNNFVGKDLYLGNPVAEGSPAGNDDNIDGTGIWFGSGASSNNITYNLSETSIDFSTHVKVDGSLSATTIYSGGTDLITLIQAGGGGITAHSGLTGLLVDDHPQYRLTSSTIYASDIDGSTTPSLAQFGGGSSDHYYFPALVLIKGNELYIDSDANSSTSTIDFRSGVAWIQYNNVGGQFRMGPDTKDTVIYGAGYAGKGLYLGNPVAEGSPAGNDDNVDGAGVWFGSGSSSNSMMYSAASDSILFSTATTTAGAIRSDAGVLRLHPISTNAPQDDTTGIWFTDNNTGSSITLGGGGAINVTMASKESTFHVRTGQTVLDQDLVVGNVLFVNNNNFDSTSGGGKVYFHDGVTNEFAEHFGFITGSGRFEMTTGLDVAGDITANTIQADTNITTVGNISLDGSLMFTNQVDGGAYPALNYDAGQDRFTFTSSGPYTPPLDVEIEQELIVGGGITVADNVVLGSTTFEPLSATSTWYAQKDQHLKGVQVTGTGWHRIAEIDGSAGRGEGDITLYSYGGDGGGSTPRSLTFHWMRGWSVDTSNISITHNNFNAENYWTDIRIVSGTSGAFIDANFAVVFSGASSDTGNLGVIETRRWGGSALMLEGGILSAYTEGDTITSVPVTKFGVGEDFSIGLDSLVSLNTNGNFTDSIISFSGNTSKANLLASDDPFLSWASTKFILSHDIDMRGDVTALGDITTIAGNLIKADDTITGHSFLTTGASGFFSGFDTATPDSGDQFIFEDFSDSLNKKVGNIAALPFATEAEVATAVGDAHVLTTHWGEDLESGFGIPAVAGTGSSIQLSVTDGVTAADVEWVYSIELSTKGTGTKNGAKYIAFYDDTISANTLAGFPNPSGWTCYPASLNGDSSDTTNHPLLFFSGGDSSFHAYNDHADAYALRYVVDAKQSLNLKYSSPQLFGADYGWKRLGDTLTYDDGSVTVNDSFSASTYSGITHTKGITIPTPTDSEDITLFKTNRSVTFISSDTVTSGASASAGWTLKYHTDRTNAGTTLTASTADNTTTGSGDTFSVAVAAGNWVWLETSSTGGTIEELHLTLEYRED